MFIYPWYDISVELSTEFWMPVSLTDTPFAELQNPTTHI